MSDRSLFLGIDLGTTNSAAAVFDGTQVHLVRNAQGTTLTPSIIRMDASCAIAIWCASIFSRLFSAPMLSAASIPIAKTLTLACVNRSVRRTLASSDKR